MGCDNITPWFVRLSAPFIAQPLASLYALSLSHSHVPLQWKCAIITPVSKVPSPTRPVDYRPISVLPLFSTVLEKLVIRRYLYPTFLQPPHPTSSMTSLPFGHLGPPLLPLLPFSTESLPSLLLSPMCTLLHWISPRPSMSPATRRFWRSLVPFPSLIISSTGCPLSSTPGPTSPSFSLPHPPLSLLTPASSKVRLSALRSFLLVQLTCSRLWPAMITSSTLTTSS